MGKYILNLSNKAVKDLKYIYIYINLETNLISLESKKYLKSCKIPLLKV
jgi:hypothetical protein